MKGNYNQVGVQFVTLRMSAPPTWWVSLPNAMLVELLEVYCSPRRSIVLGNQDHGCTPWSWCAHRNLPHDSNSAVSIKTLFNHFLPV